MSEYHASKPSNVECDDVLLGDAAREILVQPPGVSVPPRQLKALLGQLS